MPELSFLMSTIALALYSLSYFFNSKRNYLILQLFGNVFLSFSYFLISSYFTMVAVIIGIARGMICYIYEKKDKDGNIEFIKYDDLQKDYVAALDYIKYLELANKNFEKYVELMPNADDTKDVIAQIGYNKENIASHKTKYNVN